MITSDEWLLQHVSFMTWRLVSDIKYWFANWTSDIIDKSHAMLSCLQRSWVGGCLINRKRKGDWKLCQNPCIVLDSTQYADLLRSDVFAIYFVHYSSNYNKCLDSTVVAMAVSNWIKRLMFFQEKHDVMAS